MRNINSSAGSQGKPQREITQTSIKEKRRQQTQNPVGLSEEKSRNVRLVLVNSPEVRGQTHATCSVFGEDGGEVDRVRLMVVLGSGGSRSYWDARVSHGLV